MITMDEKTLFNRKIALYARHSKEDDTSQTIQNQLEIMTSYVTQHDGSVADTYSDEITGRFFDRPDYIRMIDDIRMGIIDTVITKDLSRLARNYLGAGEFIENFFPSYGVRYIAVTDCYDSFFDNGDFVPIKNLFNEWYSRDISRKTKAAINNCAQKGRYVGATAPYGYKKSPENKHLLVLDDESSKIIKQIFDMFLTGYSGRAIADELNSSGVPSPSQSRQNETSAWGSATILSMLKNQVYTGNIVQGKRKNLSYKSKKRVSVPPEEWIVVKNTHEPIISKKLFEQVQRLKVTRSISKRTKKGTVSLFAGLCFCSKCDSKMVYTSRIARGVTIGMYKCSGYVNKGKSFCSSNIVYEDALISEIIKYCKYLVSSYQDDRNFIRQLCLESLSEHLVRLELENLEIKRQTKELERKLEIVLDNKNNYPATLNKVFRKYEDETQSLNAQKVTISLQIQTIKKRLKSSNMLIKRIIEFILNPNFNHKLLSNTFEKIIIETENSNNVEIKPFFRMD